MPVQILTLKLDGITAGDYLTWCRDPDPPALDFALRSISIAADPLADTVTAILDWNESLPPASAAATAAGLPLPAGVQIHSSLTHESQARPFSTAAARRLTRARARDRAVAARTVGDAQPLPRPRQVVSLVPLNNLERGWLPAGDQPPAGDSLTDANGCQQAKARG